MHLFFWLALACAGEDAPSDDGSATPTDTASVTSTGDPDGDGVPTEGSHNSSTFHRGFAPTAIHVWPLRGLMCGGAFKMHTTRQWPWGI